MTLAEKYGIQKGKEVESINLGNNPYKFEGTFKEFYGLVAGGRVKALKQGGITCGISVSGYNNVEEDNLAFEAFRKVYEPYQAMTYLNLATQLVEANLIPTIISEKPLRLTILNGLVTLNEYGEEIKVEPKAEPKAEVDGPTFIVDDIEYCMVENPNTTDGRYHPMIARVDGEEVPNRKEVARKFLRNYGYEEDYFNRTNTGNLENQIYRILGEE